MVCSYSGVHRSGMISATGLSEQRHPPQGARVRGGSLRGAARAMNRRLSLNEMDLQRSQQMLALLQRQPNHLRRIFGHGGASADLMNPNAPAWPYPPQH